MEADAIMEADVPEILPIILISIEQRRIQNPVKYIRWSVL